MPEKKKYIVKESFRWGGQSYMPGASIDLTAEEAAELAAFLEEGPQAGLTAGADDQSTELQDLRAKLEQKEKDFAALQDANTRNVDDLKAARERLATMGKELGELKKAAKEKGGK